MDWHRQSFPHTGGFSCPHNFSAANFGLWNNYSFGFRTGALSKWHSSGGGGGKWWKSVTSHASCLLHKGIENQKQNVRREALKPVHNFTLDYSISEKLTNKTYVSWQKLAGRYYSCLIHKYAMVGWEQIEIFCKYKGHLYSSKCLSNRTQDHPLCSVRYSTTFPLELQTGLRLFVCFNVGWFFSLETAGKETRQENKREGRTDWVGGRMQIHLALWLWGTMM